MKENGVRKLFLYRKTFVGSAQGYGKRFATHNEEHFSEPNLFLSTFKRTVLIPSISLK